MKRWLVQWVNEDEETASLKENLIGSAIILVLRQILIQLGNQLEWEELTRFWEGIRYCSVLMIVTLTIVWVAKSISE